MMMMNQSKPIIISAENGMQAEEVWTGVVVSGLFVKLGGKAVYRGRAEE
jgi:hypothetical protein